MIHFIRTIVSSGVSTAAAAGEVDMAIVWGPFAGYFAPRQSVPLDVVPVSPQVDPPSLLFVFDISIGLRRGDETFRAELEAILERKRPEIDKILAEYGVPRVPAATLRSAP